MPELNWPTKINLRKKIFIMTDVTQRYHVTLPSSKVIQKFYLDFPNKMAYFLQMAAGSATDMTLTYGGFDPSNSEINLSNNPTQMHLTNFGHGQTFELFNWNNQLYAWVMTYAGSNVNKDGDHWATRVARLPIDGNSKTPTDVNSITFLNYMGTGAGNKNMTLYRADAPLSSDKSRLAVWTQQSKTGTKKRVTAFKTDVLNQVMDTEGNIKCTDSRMKKGGSAYVSTRDISSYNYPQGSWQGMELSNKTSAGYNWVYLTSGQAKNPSVIVRAPWNFASPAPQNITAKITDFGSHDHETEAPQLYGNDVYFGVEEKKPASGKLNEHYIYSISKDSFTN